MDLASVDELAIDKRVKHLLDCQDLFDRTLDAKGIKTTNSKEVVCAFLNIITKQIKPQSF